MDCAQHAGDLVLPRRSEVTGTSRGGSCACLLFYLNAGPEKCQNVEAVRVGCLDVEAASPVSSGALKSVAGLQEPMADVLISRCWLSLQLQFLCLQQMQCEQSRRYVTRLFPKSYWAR